MSNSVNETFELKTKLLELKARGVRYQDLRDFLRTKRVDFISSVLHAGANPSPFIKLANDYLDLLFKLEKAGFLKIEEVIKNKLADPAKR